MRPKRTIPRHFRLRAFGRKLGRGFEDTRFDGIASARARERARAARDVAEHMSAADHLLAEDEPHGPGCPECCYYCEGDPE